VTFELNAYDYDQNFEINGVSVSLHPAGHVRGSSQVRLEHGGQVWVFSGDYKRAEDPSCESFTPLQADVFITEATFGLPIYKWEPGAKIVKQIYDWWQKNKELNKCSMLFGYSLGKTQRILAELAKITDETVYIHGALDPITQIYREEGVSLLDTELVVDQKDNFSYEGKLVLSPPSTHRSRWMRRFKNAETAFASGWMRVRGRRRMGGYDKGFVISDHVDWPGLLKTIEQSQANEVYAIYGFSEVLTRYLREEIGIAAQPWQTGFTGEDD
jgi:putative mRNA 3-end processing factor